MSFKFSWAPNSKKVQQSERPVNELDKQPGYVEQRDIVDLVDLFAESEGFIDKIKDILSSDSHKENQKGKPIQYAQMPKLMQLSLGVLATALAVQRRIDWDHLIRIITNWDSRRPATVNVVYHPKLKIYFITDGQHTVLAIAIRAMLGLFPDVDKKDWKNIKVNCQVVETSDLSFAREHFLGINGEDKLRILPYDIHKIHVFGKRLDNSSQEKYILAERKQTEFEKYNIVPVHPESTDRFKPGSLVDVNLIKKLDPADITFIGKNHDTYWPQEPVDAMEMLPFQDLRRRLEKEGADFDSKDFKEFMRDINAVIKEVAGGFAEFKNLTQQVYPEYYERAFGERPAGCPRDASLVLLLQLYQKANGTYEFVPKSLTTRYLENGKSMFQCLPKAKRSLFQ